MSLLLDDAIDDPILRGMAAERYMVTAWSPARQSLSDALHRLGRAGEHLAEVESGIERFADEQKDAVAIKVEGMTISMVGNPPMPPRKLNILIGEVFQNLRTALDYLVYALSWLDSAVHTEGTQFPAESNPKKFRGRLKSYLRNVSSEHVAAIRALQPCEGCKWTGVLVNASNMDKHWAVPILNLQGSGTVSVGDAEGGPPKPGEVRMYHPPVEVAFADGSIVLPTLNGLEAEVRSLLEAFDAEFERYGLAVGSLASRAIARRAANLDSPILFMALAPT